MSKAAVLIALLGLASSASAIYCNESTGDDFLTVIQEKCADKTDPIEIYKCGVANYEAEEVECGKALEEASDAAGDAAGDLLGDELGDALGDALSDAAGDIEWVCAGTMYELKKEGEDGAALEITIPDRCYQKDLCEFFEDDEYSAPYTAPYVEGYEYTEKDICCTGNNCNAPSSAFGAAASALVAAMALVSVALF